MSGIVFALPLGVIIVVIFIVSLFDKSCHDQIEI